LEIHRQSHHSITWNGHRVVVYSGSRFLFQDSALEAFRTKRSWSPSLWSCGLEKRYLIGSNLGINDQVHAGYIRDTAGIAMT